LTPETQLISEKSAARDFYPVDEAGMLLP